MFKERSVMKSYSVLTTNAHITDANFYYTEFGRPNYYWGHVDRILDNKALYVHCTVPVKKQKSFFALLRETGKRYICYFAEKQRGKDITAR